MKYQNPIIPGFYPDPSICKANGKYYLVCSSFQYFPGVPLFESEDLINWKCIGHVLTRESQLPLEGAGVSGGIYAPTIRYNNGRFYMVTTNVNFGGNFYVYTDDIYGEWSEPIFVEQGGIDPSLYFEDGKTYFTSNGEADDGEQGITQCEIDIETGKKLTPSVCIYKGAGGRYIESPHLYKFGNTYYIMVAEGGTEYGHMVVYAKGNSPYGPFENYPSNPVLTNRNLGGYVIQGCGHGDIIEDYNGNFWMVHLAFRQIDRWMPFHITGREVCLVPVKFNEDGWFKAGVNGITPIEIETPYIAGSVEQKLKMSEDFTNTEVGKDWVFIRNPHLENYELTKECFVLTQTPVTLADKEDSPTAVCIRQRQMKGDVSCKLSIESGEAGISLYMDETHHYDLCIYKTENGCRAVKRSCIGSVECEQNVAELEDAKDIVLNIRLENKEYAFSVVQGDKKYDLGKLETRYLSSEVACGFTGVMFALYAFGEDADKAIFTDFEINYENE
ncbi:MAG: glycoside hydrolase family 43 protein [Lachnospiraceae bacterium]|nr:glycoside hydrolase family 43 protein [Lachnospiraceae bacterium]